MATTRLTKYRVKLVALATLTFLCALFSLSATASTPTVAYPFNSNLMATTQPISPFTKPTSIIPRAAIDSKIEYAIIDADLNPSGRGTVKIYSYNNSLITSSASNLEIGSFPSYVAYLGEDQIVYASAKPTTKVILLYKNINSGQTVLNSIADIRSLQGMPYIVIIPKTSMIYFAIGNSTTKFCRMSPLDYNVQCGLGDTTNKSVLHAREVPGMDRIVSLHNATSYMITVINPTFIGSPNAQISIGGMSNSGMLPATALIDNLDVFNYIVQSYKISNVQPRFALTKFCIDIRAGCESPPCQLVSAFTATSSIAAFFQNVGTFNIVLLTSLILVLNDPSTMSINTYFQFYRKHDLSQYAQSIEMTRTVGAEQRHMYILEELIQPAINLLNIFGCEYNFLPSGVLSKKYSAIIDLQADPCTFLSDGLISHWPSPTTSHLYPLQVHHCHRTTFCSQSPAECELSVISTLALSTSVTFTFSHPLHSSLLSPLALLPLTNASSNLTSIPFTTFIYDTTLTIIFDTPLESYSLSFLSKYPSHIPLPVISADFKRMFQHNLTASYASYPTATDAVLNATATAAQTLTVVAPVVLVALSSAKVSGDTNFLMLSPTFAFILTKMQANFIYLYSFTLPTYTLAYLATQDQPYPCLFSGPNLVFPTYIMDRLRRSQSSHVLALQAKIDSLQPNRNCQTTLPNSLVKIGFHCQFLHSAGADPSSWPSPSLPLSS